MSVPPPPRLRCCLPVALAVAGALGVAAGRADADQRRVLVVDATADGAGADAVTALDRALGPEPALTPVPVTLTAPLRKPTPVDDSWRATAETALEEARGLMARFAYRQAAQRARGAQDVLAGLAGLPEGRRLLAELALAEALAEAGDTGVDAALPTFALVHRLDPNRTLDPARYLPEVVRAFVAAAGPLPGTGTLVVAAPGAAEILIDGTVVGPEPANLVVPSGPHVVTARGEAIDPVGRRVEATPGRTVRVDLTPVVAPLAVRLARARDRLRAATDDRARTDALTALLALVTAKDAVVVVGGDGQLAARLYTARGGLGPARPIGDDARAVIAPLRPIVRPIRPPRPPVPPPVPPEPWYQRRWAKTGLGVVAAAVVIGVVTAVVTQDPGNSSLSGLEVE